MTPTVREAVAADRPALLDLWVEAWAGAMPEIDFEARRGWMAERLDALEAAGATVLVACDAEAVAGLATVDVTSGDLDQLVVSVTRQGQGFAKALLRAAKVLSPGGLRLSVNTDNRRAIRLYECAGFAVSGTGTNPRSGLPVYRMQWVPDRAVRRS